MDKMKNGGGIRCCSVCLDTDAALKPASRVDFADVDAVAVAVAVAVAAPTWICFKCEHHLNDFRAFKAMCRAAERILRRVVDLPTFRSERSRLLKFKYLSAVRTHSVDIPPRSDAAEDACVVLSASAPSLFDDAAADDFDDGASDRPAEIAAEEVRLTDEDVALERKRRMNSDEYADAPYKCDACVLRFGRRRALETHMRKHSEARGPHVCPVCRMRFGSALRLGRHSALHYRRYVCNVCGKLLDGKRRLNDHLAMHAGRTYPCRTCGALFTNRSTLNNHTRNKHGRGEHRCETCDRVFGVKERLKEHRLRHSEPGHPCDVCDKRFFSARRLARHKTDHSDDRRHYCVECDAYFKSETLLKNHLRNAAKHADPSSLRYACERCDRRFRSQTLLTQHANAAHLDRRPFACEACGSSYASRQGLNFHRRLAHQGYRIPKSHACERCGKSFTSKGILANHVRVHTGEKPFECSQCGRKFSQKSSLRTHIRLVHLKMKRRVGRKEDEPTPRFISIRTDLLQR